MACIRWSGARSRARSAITLARALLVIAFVPSADARTLPEVLPGHWYEIPDSKLRKVGAQAALEGSINRITAWSGAALDPATSRLYVWGGGHADYAGNEVYEFDLLALAWERLTEPARTDREQTDVYADGSPRARHSYNCLEFLPAQGRLVSFGGASLYPRGGATTRRISEFNPRERRWVTGNRSDIPGGGSMIGAQARLDSGSGDVFFLAAQRASPLRYSPVDDQWHSGWGAAYVRVHATMAIDPRRRQLVLIGSGTERPQALQWNLDRPGAAVDLRQRTTGTKEIEAANAPGFDYHPKSGKFVAWSGGGDVYVLDPDRWHWQRITPAAANVVSPGAALTTGTYGRFRYVPALDLFVLMNGVDRNVFVYRLPQL